MYLTIYISRYLATSLLLFAYPCVDCAHLWQERGAQPQRFTPSLCSARQVHGEGAIIKMQLLRTCRPITVVEGAAAGDDMVTATWYSRGCLQQPSICTEQIWEVLCISNPRRRVWPPSPGWYWPGTAVCKKSDMFPTTRKYLPPTIISFTYLRDHRVLLKHSKQVRNQKALIRFSATRERVFAQSVLVVPPRGNRNKQARRSIAKESVVGTFVMRSIPITNGYNP